MSDPQTEPPLPDPQKRADTDADTEVRRAGGGGASGPPPGSKKVRSGLAERRNPFAVAMGNAYNAVGRLVFKDLLNTFLLLAAIGLGIAYPLLLDSIKPSSVGTPVPLSTVHTLVTPHQVATAVVLDHDNRIELTTVPTRTAPRRLLWASYPASGAATQQLLSEL